MVASGGRAFLRDQDLVATWALVRVPGVTCVQAEAGSQARGQVSSALCLRLGPTSAPGQQAPSF